MRFLDNKTIVLDKEINDLDRFVLDFVKVLSRYTDYIIISGYISILFGRSRGTEDVDIIVPKLSHAKFIDLFNELSNSFHCLNSDNKADLFDYLNDKLSIRFARKDQVIPNIELKFANNNIDEISLLNKIKVIIGRDELFVGPLELQIVYKKIILKSDKDLEDARHLEVLFKEHLSKESIKYYERLVTELWNKK